MTELARFEDAFAAALSGLHGPVLGSVDALAAQPAFAVYRNTVASACIDALQANFPTVSQLVGEQWFRAAAAIYAKAHPPRHPAMLEYGAEFADFLARFEPAAEIPYLAGVARLDGFWSRAHVAPDADPLEPAALARLAPDRLGAIAAVPHPSAHWAVFEKMPVATIWRRHRDADPHARIDLDDVEWIGDALLITRPHDDVRWLPIEPGAAAFLDACARGESLAAAAGAALRAQPETDLARMMAALLEAGALSELRDITRN